MGMGATKLSLKGINFAGGKGFMNISAIFSADGVRSILRTLSSMTSRMKWSQTLKCLLPWVTLGISAMAVVGLESTHIGITSLDGNSRSFNRFLANLISWAHSLIAWYSASQLDKQTCGDFLECQERDLPLALRVYP